MALNNSDKIDIARPLFQGRIVLIYGILDIVSTKLHLILHFFSQQPQLILQSLPEEFATKCSKRREGGLRALLEQLAHWYRLVASQSSSMKLRSEYQWPAPLPCGQHMVNFNFATCQASRKFDIFGINREVPSKMPQRGDYCADINVYRRTTKVLFWMIYNQILTLVFAFACTSLLPDWHFKALKIYSSLFLRSKTSMFHWSSQVMGAPWHESHSTRQQVRFLRM